MRILYLSQYFPPEIGATQSRARAMTRGLALAGHEVTVITEVPNHPVGEIHPEYRGRAVWRQREGGVDVRRVWVHTRPEKGTLDRLLFYSTFMAMATIEGVFRCRGRYDIIYVTSPPLPVAAAALAIRLAKRIPMVLEIRDLWPESAEQLGELNSGTARRWSRSLESAAYRKARHIVAVTGGIHARLLERGIAGSKVTVIPNGADTELFRPAPRDPKLRESVGIPHDAFVAIYAGLHGLAHGLETVLEAARLLGRESGIWFLMVGEGPEKSSLERLATELGLRNVRFHDAVPEEELAAWIRSADVGIDTRRDLPISAGTLPVKMFSYLACGRPVLLAGRGEARELVSAAQVGVCVDPENPTALADALVSMKSRPDERAAWSENGPPFVREHYSRTALAADLVKLLDRVAK